MGSELMRKGNLWFFRANNMKSFIFHFYLIERTAYTIVMDKLIETVF